MDPDLKALAELVERYRHEKGAPIALLHDLNGRYGYIPEPALRLVSERLAIPLSTLFSMATFYKCFTLAPRGKHSIKVCTGTACHVKGAPRILEHLCGALAVKPGETTADGKCTLETVNCLGACALAPLVTFDEHYLGKFKPSAVDELMGRVRDEE